MGLEIDELIKIIIAVVLLVVLVWAVIYLFKGKGSSILDAIKNLLGFGK